MLQHYAKQLRKSLTPEEEKLWSYLRDRRFEGLKFYRQKVLGPYIVDFYCPEKKLVIELDGGQHNQETHEEKDKLRDAWLKSQGYMILRIWNNQLNNLNAVFETILKLTTYPSSALWAPSPHGEKEKLQKEV